MFGEDNCVTLFDLAKFMSLPSSELLNLLTAADVPCYRLPGFRSDADIRVPIGQFFVWLGTCKVNLINLDPL